MCQNVPGNFICSCPDGLIGDPITSGCRKAEECFSDSDCPNTAACRNAHCTNPCHDDPNVCGANALCTATAHAAVCSCPPNTRGDPHTECRRIECSDNNDCDARKSCIDYHCVDPCSLSNSCGQNADCSVENHVGVCSCRPGHTGNPLLGCVSIQYCSSDQQCQAGTICNAGVCCALCTSNRECIGDQLCLQGVCQSTCHSNATCPDFQYCLNNICTQEVRCRGDADCDSDETCVQDSFGRSECKNACNGRTLCGRNAECTARNHATVCSCKAGFTGDAKSGCRRIECESDEECSSDKMCDGNMCKIACLMGGSNGTPCGVNALCSAENHKQVCYCQPGFTGNPLTQCEAIDFCRDVPCGPGARCRNSKGTFQCTCGRNLVGDPYNEGCRPAVECLSDDDCPASAACVQLKGEPKCQDVCEDVSCGRNAVCLAEQHQAKCGCRPGYDGNPLDTVNGCRPLPVPCHLNSDCPANSYCHGQICKPTCSLDFECNPDEVCHTNQCINPCEQPKACGMNADCSCANHRKECQCPGGFTGNADVECVRIPVSCAVNTDCGVGHTCRDSMCLPHCQSDQECALNEKCLDGNCMLTCRVDNDCFLGHICLNNKCIFACHSDEDCSASESCRNNTCKNPCIENPCGPNAVCSIANHRASCSCLSGMVASPTATIGCVRTPAIGCRENRDCPQGHGCFDELCRPMCANDGSCLSNERCERGSCKPLCRRDDDCRSSEICQGLVCVAGCRSDGECPPTLACENQQCIDPCASSSACGTNAKCSVVGHRKQCTCPAPLIGDPVFGCKYAPTVCATSADCPAKHSCYGNVCQKACRSDQNCLSDERCVRGNCRTICNSDSACGHGEICENRLCQLGCRSDTVCPADQACINNKCKDPCSIAGQCGACAECSVSNHAVQCSCPAGFLYNDAQGCSQPLQHCNSYCQCDELGVFCAQTCSGDKDCACGQTCSAGKCRAKCNPGACPAGQLCQRGACIAGCRTHHDCPSERSCLNGQCLDPCLKDGACGKNALCKVSEHNAICLCPDGFQGDAKVACEQYECATDIDCEYNKFCDHGQCKNPCLQSDACGLNAQCRVVNRKAQCSCPPGHYGNANVECQPQPADGGCARNPCGANARCRDVSGGGFECSCAPGCVGDPRTGCICGEDRVNVCANQPCGRNAACRVLNHDEPECYCPPEFPNGDPYTECKLIYILILFTNIY